MNWFNISQVAIGVLVISAILAFVSLCIFGITDTLRIGSYDLRVFVAQAALFCGIVALAALVVLGLSVGVGFIRNGLTGR